MANCPQCGAPVDQGAVKCKYCGEPIQQQAAPQPQVYQQPQVIVQQAPYNPQQAQLMDGISPAWPIKSKIAAGILAIFFGGIGVHKFYLGQVGMGVVYLLFCWTCIPAVLGLIEGIIYLTSNDHNFQIKNRVRIQ